MILIMDWKDAKQALHDLAVKRGFKPSVDSEDVQIFIYDEEGDRMEWADMECHIEVTANSVDSEAAISKQETEASPKKESES